MRLHEVGSSALFRATRRTTGEEFVITMKPPTFHQFVGHHRLRDVDDASTDQRCRFGFPLCQGEAMESRRDAAVRVGHARQPQAHFDSA